MRTLIAALCLLVAAAFALPAAAQTGKDPAVFANTVLTSDTGRQVHLSDFRGKVVFINFWGSWCPPCQKEMPSIRQMQTALQDRANDIEYVFISTKTETFARDIARLRELGMAGHTYRWEPRSDAQWHTFFGNAPGGTHYYVPTTYILDRSGNVALMRVEAVEWEVHANDIRALLARG